MTFEMDINEVKEQIISSETKILAHLDYLHEIQMKNIEKLYKMFSDGQQFSKSNTRLKFDISTARILVKKVLFRHRIETNKNELWATLECIFDMPPDNASQKIKTMLSKCHADTKCEFGSNLKLVRSDMNDKKIPYLGEDEDQYIKYGTIFYR